MLCSILNIEIESLDKESLLQRFQEGFMVTPNLDHLVMLQEDQEFYHAYMQADWIICDSQILYFVSNILKYPFVKAIAGSTFFHDYYMFHKDDLDCKIFILGGKNGVACTAMNNINRVVGRNIVVGAHSPSFHIDQRESEEISHLINESAANVVLVGLGAPKQEEWIVNYRHLMPKVKTWMALGATIDFEAGVQKRAPECFRRIGMEWFWRMVHDPRRLVPRYIRDLKFFWYFGEQLLGVYRNPWAGSLNIR